MIDRVTELYDRRAAVAESLDAGHRCLSIAIKEPAEARSWLRLCIRRRWIREGKLEPLLVRLQEIRLIIDSILSNTRPESRSALYIRP